MTRIVLALLAIVFIMLLTPRAQAEDRGLGKMSVTWHMVSQEELNRRCAKIDVPTCKGLADWSTNEIWTLPPTGASDSETLFVVMHELSHIKLGCYHGPEWNDYIGPEKDGKKCLARRNRSPR